MSKLHELFRPLRACAALPPACATHFTNRCRNLASSFDTVTSVKQHLGSRDIKSERWLRLLAVQNQSLRRAQPSILPALLRCLSYTSVATVTTNGQHNVADSGSQQRLVRVSSAFH